MNLTALTDMTPIVFNTTDITNPETAIPTLITTSNDVSEGYFGLGIMIAIFIVLLYTSFRQDGDIRLDISRSILMASGFSSIVGIILLATPITSSFVHVMWFLTIFIVMVVVMFNIKRRGG